MPPARLHVRTLALDTLSAARHERLTRLLDDDEQSRAARFAFARHRREYETAHGLLRETVAALTGADPRVLAFRPEQPGGKPRLITAVDRPCDVNISHAEGLTACVVAFDAEVGIDVEFLGRRTDHAIATRFFAADEAQWLAAQPEDGRGEAFLALWTLKEAFVKATGEGLAMDLASFSVRPDPPRLLAVPASAAPLSAWRLWQWRPGARHLAALAARLPPGAGDGEPALDLRSASAL